MCTNSQFLKLIIFRFAKTVPFSKRIPCNAITYYSFSTIVHLKTLKQFETSIRVPCTQTNGFSL